MGLCVTIPTIVPHLCNTFCGRAPLGANGARRLFHECLDSINPEQVIRRTMEVALPINVHRTTPSVFKSTSLAGWLAIRRRMWNRPAILVSLSAAVTPASIPRWPGA